MTGLTQNCLQFVPPGRALLSAHPLSSLSMLRVFTGGVYLLTLIQGMFYPPSVVRTVGPQAPH